MNYFKNKLFIRRILIFVAALFSSLSLFADDHGIIQIKKFVFDRPKAGMAPTNQGVIQVDLNSKLFKSVSKLFTLDDGRVILWDPKFPDKELQYIADHTIPVKDQPGKIRVRSSYRDSDGLARVADFEILWNALVYELINIQSYDSFITLYNRSINEGMTKEKWVEENMKIEFDALKKSNKFYIEFFKPWMEAMNVQPTLVTWGVEGDCKFGDWLESVRKNNRYRYWDDYYELYLRTQP